VKKRYIYISYIAIIKGFGSCIYGMS